MSLRNPLSRLKKHLERKRDESSRKITASLENRADPTEPGSAYSVVDPEAGGSGVVGEPVSTDESDTGQEDGQANVDRNDSETQVPGRPLGVECSMGSGGGSEVEQVHPSPSSIPIPYRARPGDAGVVPNTGRAGVHRGRGTEPNTAADRKKPSWKSTVYTTTKLLLCGVRDAGDAFGPLKSVAGSLYFILDNCERTMANKQAIESLAPRVKTLSDQLARDAPAGDIKEVERRNTLWGKLEGVARELELLGEQGNIQGFFSNVVNADKLGGLVEDIRDAVMDYQTLLQQDIYHKNCQLIGDVELILLDKMNHANDAGHRSGKSRQGCLRGTRMDILRQLEDWLEDEQSQRVFWLNGLAGTGGSTIARTFAEVAFAEGKLGASFFCSRGFENRSNVHAIFPTLAFQLHLEKPCRLDGATRGYMSDSRSTRSSMDRRSKPGE